MMLAAVFEDVGKPLEIRAVDDPTPGAGELILRVKGCGICGSDLHATELSGGVPAGTVMGHEFAGEIAEVGKGVQGWKVGDRARCLRLAVAAARRV